jgi:hypothetical protein
MEKNKNIFTAKTQRPQRKKRRQTGKNPYARALVNLAYAGFHACLIVFLDFRIRENDGRRCAIAFKPIRCPQAHPTALGGSAFFVP